MPSASASVRPRLYVRMAWLIAGVGVYRSARVDHRDDVVGGQHFQRRHPGRLGKPVRVTADEQRPRDAVSGTVLDDGLGDRQNMGLVERSVERRAAVTRRAEHHLLSDVVGIGS